MAEEKFFKFGPTALTNTLTTNLLNPPVTSGGTNASGTKYYIVLDHISIVNKTASPATCSFWLGASGANAAGTEVIAQGVSVPANQTFEWHGILKITSNDFLVGGASANTTLSILGQGRIVADPGFRPITRTYNSGTAQTETAPVGAIQVVIEVWGGGGGGARFDGTPNGENPLGGGGGGYSRETVALNGSGTQTWTYTVGTGGAGALSGGAGGSGGASSVTGTSANSANGGQGGDNNGLGGAGGTATGGDVNTTGGNGINPTGGSSPNGGAGGGAGLNGDAPGGGGGSNVNANGGNGAAGRIVFAYT